MSKSLLVNHELGKIKSGDGVNRGVLELDRGSSVTAGAGYIKLVPVDGITPRYLFIDDTGDLRIHTAAPTGDTNGTIVGTQT